MQPRKRWDSNPRASFHRPLAFQASSLGLSGTLPIKSPLPLIKLRDLSHAHQDLNPDLRVLEAPVFPLHHGRLILEFLQERKWWDLNPRCGSLRHSGFRGRCTKPDYATLPKRSEERPYPSPDLNRYVRRHWGLRPACLPIPSDGLA